MLRIKTPNPKLFQIHFPLHLFAAMSKKIYKKPTKKAQVKEPASLYKNTLSTGNNLTLTTFEELEEMDREHTRRMTHNERMEYLQKLIYNVWGPDLSKQEAELKKGKLTIRKI